MYRHSYNSQRTSSRFPRAKRRIKTMDVALLTQKTQAIHPVVEHKPVKHRFSDFLITERLKGAIYEKGYQTPTPIQDEVIPYALQGKDVVGIANTGTGKTAAFLIPLINKILLNKSERVLIVAPTRELAVQIQDEVKGFTRGMDIFSALCIGGVSLYPQIQALRQNPNIIIGTPGRLKDLKNQGKLSIALCANIVLDEVDRMLDMGFIHDVRFIISHLPARRQSLFFSATMTPNVKTIIATLSQNPIMISVKQQETASNVDQNVVKINGRSKVEVLHDILNTDEVTKTIIFGRTKWGIESLSRQLSSLGFTVTSLHGNKSQNQRQRSLDLFRQNKIRILLATDIAARGIDINDISHVINFDLPETYEDYVHRIGRTGRNNKKGTAISFVD